MNRIFQEYAGFSARVCGAFEELLQKEEAELAVVAHGGTQMAVLDRWGQPAREYWQWQRPCGCGWLLEYGKGRDAFTVLREVGFLQ